MMTKKSKEVRMRLDPQIFDALKNAKGRGEWDLFFSGMLKEYNEWPAVKARILRSFADLEESVPGNTKHLVSTFRVAFLEAVCTPLKENETVPQLVTRILKDKMEG